MHSASGAIGVVRQGGTAQPTGMQASMFEVMGTEGGITFEWGGMTICRRASKRMMVTLSATNSATTALTICCAPFSKLCMTARDVPVAAEAGRYAVELCWAAALQSACEKDVRWQCPSHRMPIRVIRAIDPYHRASSMCLGWVVGSMKKKAAKRYRVCIVKKQRQVCRQ